MNITEFLEARITEDELRANYYGPLAMGTARVLAECAAKRAIIRRHATITVWPEGTGGAKFYYGSKQVCASCDERTQTPCPTIGLIAAIYKDHPDYQEEWAL